TVKILKSKIFEGIFVGLLVAIGMSAVRYGGHLEPFELRAHDWFIRSQPAPHQQETRIVLIGITEEDIRQLGRWPLTDRMLADVLAKLRTYGPVAIGLDIYRDFAVPPGTKEL